MIFYAIKMYLYSEIFIVSALCLPHNYSLQEAAKKGYNASVAYYRHASMLWAQSIKLV